MNSNKNGLTNVRELSEEANDVKGGLTIETGSRLVKEDENGWLGDKLDTNRQSLPLFNRQARARSSNQAILNVVHLKQIDYSINISKLLLAWDSS